MNSDTTPSDAPVVISYDAIRDLAFFLEQYDRLTEEIQQVKVQLASSPSLEPDSPRFTQREEWRSWLQHQIISKQHDREELVKSMRAKNICIEQLPE